MSDEERQQPEGVNVPVSLHVPEDLQSHYSHNVIVQPGQRELTLFFFETQVPPFFGTPAENSKYLLEQGVRFTCVSKIIVAPDLVPEIIKAMQTGLDNYNASKANEEREAER
jgi:hypothetical protein